MKRRSTAKKTNALLAKINKRLKRIEDTMATREELNIGLGTLAEKVTALVTAIDALIAKLGAGSADFQVELDKVTTANSALQAQIDKATAAAA